MTVEQIALRQEVRQMMNEAGINKNTMKEMAKNVMEEEFQKAIRQAFNETDVSFLVKQTLKERADGAIKQVIANEIRARIQSVFYRMKIDISIADENGEEWHTST